MRLRWVGAPIVGIESIVFCRVCKCMFARLFKNLVFKFDCLPDCFMCSADFPKMIVDRKHHKFNKWKRKEIGIRIPNDPVCQNIMEEINEPLLCGSVPEAAEDQIGILRPGQLDDINEEEWDGNDVEEEMDMWSDDEDSDLWPAGYDIDQLYSMTTSPSDFYDAPYYELSNTETLPWARLVDCVVLNGPRGGSKFGMLSTVVDCTGDSPTIVRQGKGPFDESLYK